MGNGIFSLDNAVETSSSQCETIFDNAFAILDSNLKADEQQLLESNSVDEGSSTNPREDSNNVQEDDNDNANNNDLHVSHNIENNGIDSYIMVNDAETHNNQDDDNDAPIDVPNAMILPLECYLTFPEITRETEDNEVEVVNNSGINTKFMSNQQR